MGMMALPVNPGRAFLINVEIRNVMNSYSCSGRESDPSAPAGLPWRKGVIFLFLVFAVFLQGCDKTPDKIRAVKGEKAPSFSLMNLDGDQVALADFEGKVIVVEFWATWCPPCRESLPATNKLFRKYRDRGLAAVAIAVQDQPDQVADFVREKSIDIPVLMDDGAVSQVYGVRGIPAMFFINRAGLVTNELEGYRPSVDREIESRVEELLAEPAAQ